MTRDETAVRQFVEEMAMIWADMGVPRMAARVLMTMMTADEHGLTAADLAERLRVSPAAISGSVRYLINVGLLERAPVMGSRRDLYRLPDDTWYQVNATQGGYIGKVADLSDQGLPALGGAGTPAGERVAEMRDFFRFIEDEHEAILEKWKRHQAARREDQKAGPTTPSSA